MGQSGVTGTGSESWPADDCWMALAIRRPVMLGLSADTALCVVLYVWLSSRSFRLRSLSSCFRFRQLASIDGTFRFSSFARFTRGGAVGANLNQLSKLLAICSYNPNQTCFVSELLFPSVLPTASLLSIRTPHRNSKMQKVWYKHKSAF